MGGIEEKNFKQEQNVLCNKKCLCLIILKTISCIKHIFVSFITIKKKLDQVFHYIYVKEHKWKNMNITKQPDSVYTISVGWLTAMQNLNLKFNFCTHVMNPTMIVYTPSV